MSRLMVHRAALTALVALAVALPAPAADPGAAPGQVPDVEPPNVLVFVTDDQRAGTLEVMPKLRRWFAEGGMTYSNAFATTPTCCPSRASIFTGRYAHNHGVLTSTEGRIENLDHGTTVQAYLQRAGYRTGIFGKYLNGWRIGDEPPYFNDWSILTDGVPRGYSGAKWNVRGDVRRIRRYSTEFVGRRALRFIERSRDDARPWLAFVTTWAPHSPFIPEPDARRLEVGPFEANPAVTERDRRDKPPHVQSLEVDLRVARSHRRGQLRTLTSVDDMVAGVMRYLERTGQAENTIAFFLSDNGYMWGEHGLIGKTMPYLPSVAIPLLMRWPDHALAGATDERFTANIDVAPTILQAVGVEPAEPMDGRSLLDLSWERDRLLLEYWARPRSSSPRWDALITPVRQYVEYYSEDVETPTFFELYDLQSDPWQLENLLYEKPPGPDAAAMQAQLSSDRQCAGTVGPEACP